MDIFLLGDLGNLLTTGMNVNVLYFWFLMTFAGNFWTCSLPIQTVLEEYSLVPQHQLHSLEQHLKQGSKKSLKYKPSYTLGSNICDILSNEKYDV